MRPMTIMCTNAISRERIINFPFLAFAKLDTWHIFDNFVQFLNFDSVSNKIHLLPSLSPNALFALAM